MLGVGGWAIYSVYAYHDIFGKRDEKIVEDFYDKRNKPL